MSDLPLCELENELASLSSHITSGTQPMAIDLAVGEIFGIFRQPP